MQYIGIDIIEIARIERAITHWGESFLKRVYTETEISLYRKKPASLAARFAGKEAVIKALKSKGVSLKEIEILSDPDGKPLVHLHGRAQNQANSLDLVNMAISLAHSRDYAIACAAGETRDTSR